MIDLKKIRTKLHTIAEISGNELKTSKAIKGFLEKTKPDRIISDIGGYGILAIYNGKKKDTTIVIRADMDALPIEEKNNFSYKSITKGISHKCGHDGHMTILLGFAKEVKKLIKYMPLRVILLFQPAEETAQGALRILSDNKFTRFKPDYIIGYHNIPGYKKNNVILRKEVFASASVGMTVKLTGATSHAGEPENGNTPILALSNIVQALIAIPSLYTSLDSSSNITIINLSLGEKAFGTSPGNAEISATFRSYLDRDIEIMKKRAEKIIIGIAKTYNLNYEIQWLEYFSSTVNDSKLTEHIKRASIKNDYEVIWKQKPFPWSEDFGFYSSISKTAFIGLGAGENTPELHNEYYDFPDDIIPGAVKLLKSIITEIITNDQ
jgi:amidohydrolase